MAAFTSKEELYQEEKITARISDRSHFIKEKEAKNYNSLWGGGGGPPARWLPKPSSPPPSWRNGVQNRRACRFSPRDWPASDPQGPAKESRDQCGGGGGGGGQTLFIKIGFIYGFFK